MKVGPLGKYSDEGKWEETGCRSISHIFVTYDTKGISSIQFGYVQNGALVLSKKHGSERENDSTRIVRLNHESEFITGISGEKHNKWTSYLSSLTFHTNERKHVAFQAQTTISPLETRPRTIEFHSGIHDRRELGGFFGSFNVCGLSSIGLYIRPILSGVSIIKREKV
ncbi:hypothetical protein N665_0600s0005 [Sinapis alba]|nr:hypothetical protein N665_0600s0005 [Sinapis alba]